MSIKKQGIAFVILFVLTAIGNFVIHGMLLQPAYKESANLMRGEQDAGTHMMFLMVGFFFFCLGMVWIYAQMKQTGSWLADGIRYAIAVWLIATVSRYSIYYAIQPWPSSTVWMQIGYELVLTLILGVVIGFMMREKAA